MQVEHTPVALVCGSHACCVFSQAPVTNGAQYIFNVAMRDSNNITSTYRASNMSFFLTSYLQCVHDPNCESQVRRRRMTVTASRQPRVNHACCVHVLPFSSTARFSDFRRGSRLREMQLKVPMSRNSLQCARTTILNYFHEVVQPTASKVVVFSWLHAGFL